MLHKYKYFVVYEEIDNSLRSLNNDSSIVHIKMKNIISKGIKRSMEVDFYKLMDFKYKQKKDMPEAWNIIIGDVDKFLVDFLKNFGIDMDLLYTTNVGVLNISSQNESSILWDVSYWAIYIKYLEFFFWMENEPGFSSKQTLQPLAMKKNVFQNRDKADANRLVFLCSIFQYISYKFYNEEELSYCFAVLYNENKCASRHEASDELCKKYREYVQEQLALTKIFCAFHEAYHLKKINPPGDYKTYIDRVMYNLKVLINSDEFASYYDYDIRLVKDVRKKINNMNIQDQLLDELYADAAALDLMDVVINYMNCFKGNWSLTKFCKEVREMIENFYAFNTLTYDLYAIWEENLRLMKGEISKNIYKQELHKQDIEHVIRGQMFPVILWQQIDGLFFEKGQEPPLPKERYANVRDEMIRFFDIAYNIDLKEAVCKALKQGFNEGNLTISEARDILIEWDKMEKFPNASVQDLFLTGGMKDEFDFIMFVGGY